MGRLPLLLLLAVCVGALGANTPVLDTLGGRLLFNPDGSVVKLRAQSMPDAGATVETTVALPALAPGTTCRGPLFITPAWCADVNNAAPAIPHVFQFSLTRGNASQPVLPGLAYVVNARLNVSAAGGSFPAVPSCLLFTRSAVSITQYLVTYTIPFIANQTLAGGDTEHYWLSAHAIMASNATPTDAASNALSWALAETYAQQNASAPSLFRDRGNWLGHAWSNWTSVSTWEAVAAPLVANASSHRFSVKIEVGGCTSVAVPSSSSPSSISSPVPSPLHVPSPVPLGNATDNNNVTAPPPPPPLETTHIVLIIVSSSAVFIALLVGLYFVVRRYRELARRRNNKFSFRESVANGSLFFFDVESPTTTAPLTRLRRADSTSSGSDSAVTTAVGLETSSLQKNAAGKASGDGRRTSSLASSVPARKHSAPSQASWIPADQVMFALNLGSVKGSDPAAEHDSGSESPVLVSRSEDRQTSAAGGGTPRTNVQLVESTGSSSSSDNAPSEDDDE